MCSRSLEALLMTKLSIGVMSSTHRRSLLTHSTFSGGFTFTQKDDSSTSNSFVMYSIRERVVQLRIPDSVRQDKSLPLTDRWYRCLFGTHLNTPSGRSWNSSTSIL